MAFRIDFNKSVSSLAADEVVLADNEFASEDSLLTCFLQDEVKSNGNANRRNEPKQKFIFISEMFVPNVRKKLNGKVQQRTDVWQLKRKTICWN